MNAPRPWHRLFGLSWMDFFRGTPVTVELEKDLSLKQQLLDVVILRNEARTLPRRMPDGFEVLAAHNLVTFKSHQEALDAWALCELVGHYVNYRNQVSPSFDDLLPEADFRLFAVSVRFPQKLAQTCPLREAGRGVYDVAYFGGTLRLVVVHELPEAEQNAMLHLFSADAEQLRYAASHYRPHSPETSSLLRQLWDRYRQEGSIMPDLLEELVTETRKEVVREMTPEEVRRWLSPEQRVQGMSTDELLAALDPAIRDELARRLKDGPPPS